MCETLRKTRRRGRSGVPLIRFRWRSEILFRRSLKVLIFIVSYQFPASRFQPDVAIGNQLEAGGRTLLGSRLSGLLLQDFAGVADAFLLIRIRLAHRPDV